MKFFSNEAKDTDRPDSEEDRDRAEADTVTVPQQRAGSPWSDAPGAAEDENAARQGVPGTDELPEQARAGEVGQPWTRPAGDRDAEGTTYGPDGTAVDETAGADRDRAEPDTIKDEGTFDSPTAVEPATGEPLDDRADTRDSSATTADEARADVADEDRADEARAHEDRAGEDRADDQARTDGADTRVTAAAAVPVAAAAVPVTAIPVDAAPDEDRTVDSDTVPVAAAAPASPAASDRFFPDGDTFAERFRDIQLRFVDSPKDATAEAAALLSDALDKLADALKNQQGALASGSDDTEKLRLELRGYRELLNRVVTL